MIPFFWIFMEAHTWVTQAYLLWMMLSPLTQVFCTRPPCHFCAIRNNYSNIKRDLFTIFQMHLTLPLLCLWSYLSPFLKCPPLLFYTFIALRYFALQVQGKFHLTSAFFHAHITYFKELCSYLTTISNYLELSVCFLGMLF